MQTHNTFYQLLSASLLTMDHQTFEEITMQDRDQKPTKQTNEKGTRKKQR